MSAPFLLVSEARGEFLMVEDIRAALARRGVPSLHVTVDPADLSADEAAHEGVIVLEQHPAFLRIAGTSDGDVAAAIDHGQRELGVNLRRLWKADLRSWRRGFPDDAMARLAAGYLAAWDEVLDAAGPLAGLWGEDGGHLAKRTAFLRAGARGIPMWFIYVAPLPHRLLALDNPLNRLSADEFAATEPTGEEREYATRFLADIRSSTFQLATPRDLSFKPQRVARFAKLLTEAYVSRQPGAGSLDPLYFARAYVRQRATRAALRSAYTQIGDRPFVFFPIHAGFDAQISIRAHQWENQLALIEHIAASLPYGYELAVKEHPFEVGALPLAPLRRLLARRPEVKLLDPSIHAHAILPRCSGVATVNSTTGYEALFFRKPVVTFGHGPYRGLGLTRDVVDVFQTPEVLLAALEEPPPSEEDATRLVTFVLRHSYDGTSLAYDVGPENIECHAAIFEALAHRAAADDTADPP
jgi:hypothetical protein